MSSKIGRKNELSEETNRFWPTKACRTNEIDLWRRIISHTFNHVQDEIHICNSKWFWLKPSNRPFLEICMNFWWQLCNWNYWMTKSEIITCPWSVSITTTDIWTLNCPILTLRGKTKSFSKRAQWPVCLQKIWRLGTLRVHSNTQNIVACIDIGIMHRLWNWDEWDLTVRLFQKRRRTQHATWRPSKQLTRSKNAFQISLLLCFYCESPFGSESASCISF